MKLSPVQQVAIDYARKNGGVLFHCQAGYWRGPDEHESLHFHTATILQLVNNGVATFDTEIQPNKCTLTAAAMADIRCDATFDDGNEGGPHKCELIAGHNGKHQERETAWGYFK